MQRDSGEVLCVSTDPPVSLSSPSSTPPSQGPLWTETQLGKLLECILRHTATSNSSKAQLQDGRWRNHTQIVKLIFTVFSGLLVQTVTLILD